LKLVSEYSLVNITLFLLNGFEKNLENLQFVTFMVGRE
jgi:hypothetical protein